MNKPKQRLLQTIPALIIFILISILCIIDENDSNLFSLWFLTLIGTYLLFFVFLIWGIIKSF